MSKSKLNGLTPDEIIDEYGADALRLYVMFLAPLDKEKVWNTEGIQGCFRFLDRFFDLCTSDSLSDVETPEALKFGHALVQGIEADFEQFQFNTAISKLMIFVSQMTKLSDYPRSILLMAVQCLYPLAPHIACELWALLGKTEPLESFPFCKWDPKFLVETTATYVVQINGKLRGKFELGVDLPEKEILAQAQAHPGVQKHLDGKVVIKTIYVPNKLLNFVVKE